MTSVALQNVAPGAAASLLTGPADGHHLVHFYEDEAFLFDVVGQFLGAGLDAGDRLVVIATPEHRNGFLQRLQDRDVDRAVADGQLLLLDAKETLARFMVEGRPDADRFHRVLQEALTLAVGGLTGVRVRAYGEMVDLLWRDGQRSAAIALEELWNEAGTRHAFSLLCAYVMANFYKGGDGVGFEDVCRTHSHVLSDESVADLRGGLVREGDELEVRRLRKRLQSVEMENERLRELQGAMRESSLEQRHAAQKALLASEARFHQLVDAVTDYAIFSLDAGGHVMTWNPGARKIKGYRQEEILGQHFSIFYPAEDRAGGKPERVLETVRREGRFEDEGWRVRNDGSRFWANVVITALRDEKGEIAGFAKVTRDLTARRQAEEKQRELEREQVARAESERAARELERLNREGAAIRRELEQANRAKDEFLATMSHELRTPLNAMLGWASILRRDHSDPAKLERGLQVIERNAKAQTRLIGDVLDVSRIISGKLRLSMKKTPISAAIYAASDAVRAAAEAKGVRLVLDLHPDVGMTIGDPDRLQQIMWNLLVNAVRFTPAGGRVTVTAQRRGAAIIVRVKDTGAGIAAEHLPHVFERFRQVESSTTRSHGGLGLGLAIVRHLVEAHGGSVDATSDGLGSGATFTIQLPIPAVTMPPTDDAAVETTPEAEPAPATRPADLRNVRALVVDDEPDSLELVRVLLEGAGATVTTAEGTQAALAARGPFDIIVSDIGMSGADGYALMRRIRSRESGGLTPAIALTAYARPQDADRAIRSGYQEHLVKPVDGLALIAAVDRWTLWNRPDSAEPLP